MRTMMLGLVACVAVGCGTARSASLTQTYSSFFVLGDSLSDRGNLYAATGATRPSSPPYFAGRFSNGPVWNEPILAEFAAAGLPAANGAFGGARAIPNPPSEPGGDIVPDLAQQRALLLAQAAPALAAGPRDVVSLWFGANDAFAAIGAADQAGRVEDAAAAIATDARALGRAGAETILVFTLPDLGRTPRYAFAEPAGAAAASAASERFNDALRTGLAGVTEAEVRIVDVAPVFDALLEADAGAPCVIPTGGGFDVCADPDGRVFFDPVHPTERVHRVIEAEARRALDGAIAPVPVPAGGLLLLCGIGALGFARRRRPA